ncbi:MAG: hypothetical protein ACP6IP_08445 [Candidatus Njordarchaeia archaeon]
MRPVYFNGAYFLPIRINNPFNGKTYPAKGEVLALIDTSFNGFLMINKSVFRELNLEGFVPTKVKIEGVCCKTYGVKTPIRVIVPFLNLVKDGEAIYLEKNSEILVGMEFLSKLNIIMDNCAKRINIEPC